MEVTFSPLKRARKKNTQKGHSRRRTWSYEKANGWKMLSCPFLKWSHGPVFWGCIRTFSGDCNSSVCNIHSHSYYKNVTLGQMGRESSERHYWPLRFLRQSLKLNIGFPQNSRFPYHTLHVPYTIMKKKNTQEPLQIIQPTCWFAMILPVLGNLLPHFLRENTHIVRVSLLDSPSGEEGAPAILSTATPPPQQSSKIVATPPAAPRRRVRRVTPCHLWEKSWCGEEATGISRFSKVKLLNIWNMWCLESGTI